MKVIIVGPAHPYRGGIAASNQRLAEQYIAEGHKVETVTFTLQYPSFLFPGKTQYSTDPAPELDIVRRINSINPFNWIKVGREIAKAKPDLVVLRFWLPFLSPCFSTIARTIKRGHKNTKIVSIVDNIIPHEKRIGDSFFAQYFVNSADGFVSMSHSVQQDLKQFNKKNKPSLFSPHPIYDNFGEKAPKTQAAQSLGLDPNARYLLFFGIIRDYKGLDILIDALSDDRLRGLGVKLIVAGEFYNDSQQYFDQAHAQKVEDMILWHNEFIADAKVKDYFGIADIVVQTYKSATQSGITQIAYHFDRPMLVTRVGGLAEIVPHGKVGYAVDTNARAVADALVDFYENDRHDGFVEGVIEEKKRFDWGAMVSTIEQIITKK